MTCNCLDPRDTCDIPTGGLTALLGPSGGGKSTLLRVIAGLVEIEGREATGLPVRRNIAFGLEIRKRPKADITRRVDELLELVGPRSSSA